MDILFILLAIVFILLALSILVVALLLLCHIVDTHVVRHKGRFFAKVSGKWVVDYPQQWCLTLDTGDKAVHVAVSRGFYKSSDIGSSLLVTAGRGILTGKLQILKLRHW